MFDTKIIYDGQQLVTGDKITCRIYRRQIKDAKVYILSQEECDKYYDNDYNDNHEGTDFEYDIGHRIIFICNNREDYTFYTNPKSKMSLGYPNIWPTIMFGPELTFGVNKLIKIQELYISPYFTPILKQDNIAHIVNGCITEEFSKWKTAIRK